MSAPPAVREARALVEAIDGGATPPMGQFIEALGGLIPQLHELRDTPQDPGWHAEGNVEIHTGMVLDELYEALARAPHDATVQGRRRTALVLGAALHDIAKPATTREMEIQGVVRTAAPRHELMGRSMLIPPLLELGLDWRTLERVVDLVGYHVSPKRLVVKARERGSYLRLARAADPELLYLLELADMRGRECEDRDTQIEHIEMFRLFAREHRAWRHFGDDAPGWRAFYAESLEQLPASTRDLSHAQFVDDLCAGLISTPEEGIARSYRHREGHPELVVTVGPSGSGKSTFVERHLEDHEAIQLDEIRAELGSRSDQSNNARVVKIGRKRLREALGHRRKIVWDATNLRRDYRDAITSIARNYGALVTLVCFPRSLAQIQRRNRDRDRDTAVPPALLRRQLEIMQWPEADEAHRRLILGSDDEVLAYYGGLGEPLPYGLEPGDHLVREPESEPEPAPEPSR